MITPLRRQKQCWMNEYVVVITISLGLFEMGSHYVSQAGFELMANLLPRAAEC